MYAVGDLVWAKMKGFSPWPGQVVEPTDKVKKPSKKQSYFVYFYGSKDYAYIEKTSIKPFFSYKDKLIKANKTPQFKEAVEAIQKYIDENDITAPLSESPECKPEKENHTKEDRPIKTEITEEPVTPMSKKRPHESKSNSGSHHKVKRPKSMTKSKESLGGASPSLGSKARVQALLDRPGHIQRPVTPSINVSCISQTLKDKKIEPSKLQFGFLGLGIMGSGIVKNLINSGHSVMVWNRSSEKCVDFVSVGAKEMMTPSDVIAAADITFSCVSDPLVAKNMVFGNCGVLKEMTVDKGYVEMTGIDAETSMDIAQAIQAKEGKYLEAQIQGSKQQADEGTLVILAAGDRQLFDDCQSCFQAMGKNSFYLGDVGNASKMNLVLQVMAGVTIAGMAEGMSLADKAGLQQKDVMEILELTSIACPLLVEKGRAMIDGNFPTHLPLHHMQKDLRLCMLMSDNLELPLHMTSSANELYKQAKRLGYAEHDVSSIYIRTRF